MKMVHRQHGSTWQEKRQKDLNRERSERSSKRKRIIAGTLASVAAVAALAYEGANLYYQRNFDGRYANYVHRLEGTVYKPNSKPSLKFLDKVRQIRRVEAMETVLDDNMKALELFAESGKDSLAKLTQSGVEHYGYIEKSGKGFNIVEKKTVKEEVIKYMSELLAGNFVNTDKLVSDISSDIGDIGFKDMQEQTVTLAAIEIVRARSTYDNLSEEGKKNFGLIAYAKDGTQIKQPIKDFEKLYTASRGLLEVAIKPIKGFIGGGVPSYVTDEILGNNRVISRWHTHPFNDPNYFPSDPDEANTHISGPNFLFSQSNGVLHVYSINRGKTREIYRTDLK